MSGDQIGKATYSTPCHSQTLLLTGQLRGKYITDNAWTADLPTSFTDVHKIAMGYYTDGYKITSTITLGSTFTKHDVVAGCFKADGKNAICHQIEGDATTDHKIAQNGHYVRWIRDYKWNNTTLKAAADEGVKLTFGGEGLIMVPDVSSAALVIASVTPF